MLHNEGLIVPVRTFAAIALLVLSGGLALAQADGEAAFSSFWRTFQQAVRQNDLDALTKMSTFPLRVHGPTDSDPVANLDAAQTISRWPKWLEQDSGMTARAEPMRTVVLRTNAASVWARQAKRGANGRSVRFGAFLFERATGAWHLTHVYEER